MPGQNESRLGSRSNPVPLGQTVEFIERNYGKEQRIRLTLTEYAWGEDAERIRNAEESYIRYGAHEGRIYVLAHFQAEYVEGPADETWSVAHHDDFKAEAHNVMVGVFINSWDGALRGVAYPGGVLSGWIAFEVPKGTEPSEVRVVYDPSWRAYDTEVWFSLTPPQ